MDRRTMVKGAAAAAAATAAAGPAKAARRQPPRTFVLVHGAWHGGWCWKHVRERLAARGHRVFTPTLTGMGERNHLSRPDVDVMTHIQDVSSLIASEELSDVVLVGHSYGGYVVEGVADGMTGALRQIVYLDALVPKDGQAMMDGTPPDQIAGIAKTLIDGFRLPPMSPEWFGVPKSDAANTAWLKRRLTDMPWQALTSPVRLPNGGAAGLPRTFIQCTREPRLPGPRAGYERAKAEGWKLETLASGHDAMVTAPGPLTDMLHRLAYT